MFVLPVDNSNLLMTYIFKDIYTDYVLVCNNHIQTTDNTFFEANNLVSFLKVTCSQFVLKAYVIKRQQHIQQL